MQGLQVSSKRLMLLLVFTVLFSTSFGAATGSLQVSTTTFAFAGEPGGPNPTYQTLVVTNAGTESLTWLIKNADGSTFSPPSWLTVGPTGSFLLAGWTTNVALMVDIAGLSSGHYAYTFKVQDAANAANSRTVSVTLDLLGPILAVSANKFIFGTPDAGTDPIPQTLVISNAGAETVNWTVTDANGLPDWLTIAPLSGSVDDGATNVTLSVSSANLTDGTYSHTFRVADPAAQNSPQIIAVFLTVGSAIHVPADYASIQDAINVIPEGGTVIVSPGTYSGNLNMNGKNIVLKSTDFENPDVVAATVINGYVRFSGSETIDCLLSGFTVGSIWGYDTLASISHCISSGIYRCHGTIEYCTVNRWGIEDCDGTIKHCFVHSTWWGQNGGMRYCDGLIDQCIITSNYARVGGGLNDCDGTISNCLISGNTALNEFGTEIGLSLDGQQAALSYVDSCGGGLYRCDGTIVNCTIVNNRAMRPLGGYYTDTFGGGLCECYGTISNCIIWGNEAYNGAQIYNCSTPVYSCIMDWTGGGTGNISSDPLFVSNGTWDLRQITIEYDDVFTGGDYHVRSEFGRWQPLKIATFEDPNGFAAHWACDTVTSPCIDAGDPASAWQNELWPHGGRINIGVYGNSPQASMSGDTVGTAADLDRDNDIDVEDLIRLADSWLLCENFLIADLDLDGLVDLTDFAWFSRNEVIRVHLGPCTEVKATPGNGWVSLDWNDYLSTQLTGYNVYRSQTLNKNFQLIAANLQESSYADLDVVNNTRYYYAVSACTGLGKESPWSMTGATPKAGFITCLTAATACQLVSLDWDDYILTDLAGYNVYRWTISDSDSIQLIASDLQTSEYTDLDVTNGVTYYYRVSAVTSLGYESPYSQVSCKPAAILPGPLTAISSYQQVNLNWPDCNSPCWSGFNVYRKGPEDPNYVMIAEELQISEYTDLNLVNGWLYNYKFSVTCTHGHEVFSAAIAAVPVLAAPTSLSTIASCGQVNLNWSDHPDPASAGFNVYRSTTPYSSSVHQSSQRNYLGQRQEHFRPAAHVHNRS